MKKKTHIVIFSIILLVAVGCRKEEAHPAESIGAISPLEIKTYEKLCNTFQFVRDTFYLHRLETNSNGYRTFQVICRASDTNALNYEWLCPDGFFIDSIGADAVVSFNPDSLEEGESRTFIITLNITNQNNELKTTTKTIFVKKLPIPWLGEFRGYNTDNPSDTFSVFFTRTDQYGTGPSCCTTYTVKNLPNGLNVNMKIPDIQTSFDFTLNNECEPEMYEEVVGYTMSAPKGFGKLSGNTIVIDYYYMTPMPDSGSGTVVYKTFIGTKVQ